MEFVFAFVFIFKLFSEVPPRAPRSLRITEAQAANHPLRASRWEFSLHHLFCSARPNIRGWSRVKHVNSQKKKKMDAAYRAHGCMQGCSATCLRSVSTCAEDYSTAYRLPLRRNRLEKKPRNESRIIPNDFSSTR